MYTYLRNQIEIAPLGREHNLCICGIGESNIVCLKSKQKGVPMKRIRYSLATIALIVTLGASFLQGVGLASLVNTASSVAGHSASPVALYRPPCPGAGSDC